jgi:hypothetical protein
MLKLMSSGLKLMTWDNNEIKLPSFKNMEESITDEPDWLASIMDSLYGDTKIDPKKRNLNHQEMKMALKQMSNRKR